MITLYISMIISIIGSWTSQSHGVPDNNLSAFLGLCLIFTLLETIQKSYHALFVADIRRDTIKTFLRIFWDTANNELDSRHFHRGTGFPPTTTMQRGFMGAMTFVVSPIIAFTVTNRKVFKWLKIEVGLRSNLESISNNLNKKNHFGSSFDFIYYEFGSDNSSTNKNRTFFGPMSTILSNLLLKPANQERKVFFPTPINE